VRNHLGRRCESRPRVRGPISSSQFDLFLPCSARPEHVTEKGRATQTECKRQSTGNSSRTRFKASGVSPLPYLFSLQLERARFQVAQTLNPKLVVSQSALDFKSPGAQRIRKNITLLMVTISTSVHRTRDIDDW
jgi:hypothetical protein